MRCAGRCAASCVTFAGAGGAMLLTMDTTKGFIELRATLKGVLGGVGRGVG
jgi:hypothetical protein